MRSMVEGNCGCKKPLHRTSCGPPPLEIAGEDMVCSLRGERGSAGAAGQGDRVGALGRDLRARVGAAALGCVLAVEVEVGKVAAGDLDRGVDAAVQGGDARRGLARSRSAVWTAIVADAAGCASSGEAATAAKAAASERRIFMAGLHVGVRAEARRSPFHNLSCKKQLTTILRFRSAKVQRLARLDWPMLDWNDLRHFLAVARTGSTLAAGRALRVSQTTAARRVAALEAELGLTLFERRPGGYRLTPAGEALVECAESVEASAQLFAEAAAAQSREASGTVRLTLEEIYRGHPAAADPARPARGASRHPHRARHERGGARPRRRRGRRGAAQRRAADGRRAGRPAPRRPTAGRSIAAAIMPPPTAARARRRQLRGHPLIGGGGPGVWRAYRAWLERNNLVEAVTMQHGSTSGLLAAVRAGSGLAVLPTLVADLDPDLLQCLPPKPDHDVGLWLLTHERLRHTPRVRAVMDFLAERLTRLGKGEGSRRGGGRLNPPLLSQGRGTARSAVEGPAAAAVPSTMLRMVPLPCEIEGRTSGLRLLKPSA